MSYQTKVMKPSNLNALAKAKELLESELVRAENGKDQGSITVEVQVKDGGSTGLKVKTETHKRLDSDNR